MPPRIKITCKIRAGICDLEIVHALWQSITNNATRKLKAVDLAEVTSLSANFSKVLQVGADLIGKAHCPCSHICKRTIGKPRRRKPRLLQVEIELS